MRDQADEGEEGAEHHACDGDGLGGRVVGDVGDGHQGGDAFVADAVGDEVRDRRGTLRGCGFGTNIVPKDMALRPRMVEAGRGAMAEMSLTVVDGSRGLKSLKHEE